MSQAGMDKAALARRVGIPSEALDRLSSIHHGTGLDQIDAAPAVLRPDMIS